MLLVLCRRMPQLISHRTPPPILPRMPPSLPFRRTHQPILQKIALLNCKNIHRRMPQWTLQWIPPLTPLPMLLRILLHRLLIKIIWLLLVVCHRFLHLRTNPTTTLRLYLPRKVIPRPLNLPTRILRPRQKMMAMIWKTTKRTNQKLRS